MGGSSKSSTSSTTENRTNNASTESGIQIIESDGNSIVMTDHDSVELSFSAIEEVSADAFDFAESAMDSVENANERIESHSSEALGTLKDFAEELKVGEQKTTKTIYLAGVGIIGLVILGFAMISVKKQKANK